MVVERRHGSNPALSAKTLTMLYKCPKIPIGGSCIYAGEKDEVLYCCWDRGKKVRIEKVEECPRSKSIKEWDLKNTYCGNRKIK